MPVFHDDTFLSCDGRTDIHVRRCLPDGPVRGTVQIAHGIAEHVERYDRFAYFLAEHGFAVAANDHLGHGQSVRDESDLGFFAENGGWELVVGDMNRLHGQLTQAYPGLPCFLFGHSMGSFLTRTYLIRYRTGLDGAIICGTGQQAPAIVAAGQLVGRAECRRHGPRHKSPLVDKMAFGSYNKLFEPRRTDLDWLTRDNDIVDAYIADPLCGFMAGVGLFTDMMGGIKFVSDPENQKLMNHELPVFIISGDKDPVGENGKGVLRCYKSFLKAGMQDVTLKLYPGCRHELLNELNYQEVQEDILAWLERKMSE